MIVIGLDVHEHSVTAVAIDEAGRTLGEKVIEVGSTELPGWANGVPLRMLGRAWHLERVSR